MGGGHGWGLPSGLADPLVVQRVPTGVAVVVLPVLLWEPPGRVPPWLIVVAARRWSGLERPLACRLGALTPRVGVSVVPHVLLSGSFACCCLPGGWCALVFDRPCGCWLRLRRSHEPRGGPGSCRGHGPSTQGVVRRRVPLLRSERWPCSRCGRRIAVHKKTRGPSCELEPRNGCRPMDDTTHACVACRSVGRGGPTSERKKVAVHGSVVHVRVVSDADGRVCRLRLGQSVLRPGVPWCCTFRVGPRGKATGLAQL